MSCRRRQTMPFHRLSVLMLVVSATRLSVQLRGDVMVVLRWHCASPTAGALHPHILSCLHLTSIHFRLIFCIFYIITCVHCE